MTASAQAGTASDDGGRHAAPPPAPRSAGLLVVRDPRGRGWPVAGRAPAGQLGAFSLETRRGLAPARSQLRLCSYRRSRPAAYRSRLHSATARRRAA